MEQTLFVRLSLPQKKRPVGNHKEDILIDACFRLLRITYFNTASFTVYLLPTLWRRRKGARHHAVGQNHVRPDDTEHAASPSGGYLPIPFAPHEEHLSHPSHRKDSITFLPSPFAKQQRSQHGGVSSGSSPTGL